jgi:hypothetical protein
MNICKCCKKEFGTRIEHGGRVWYLYNRLYCPECTPLGSRPSKRNPALRSRKEGRHICAKCQIEKPLEEFGRRSESLRPLSWCKMCSNNLRNTERKTSKQFAINHLGGKCMICGYSKCFTSLHCHHKDPSLKEFCIATAGKKSSEDLKKELDKCVLLCSNCHGEYHEGLIILP